jgi:hypothetical protein
MNDNGKRACLFSLCLFVSLRAFVVNLRPCQPRNMKYALPTRRTRTPGVERAGIRAAGVRS